eukprot:2307028-Amphidinium_carterae.1
MPLLSIVSIVVSVPAVSYQSLEEHMPREMQRGFNMMSALPETHAAGEALRLATQHQNVLPKYRRRLEENSQ